MLLEHTEDPEVIKAPRLSVLFVFLCQNFPLDLTLSWNYKAERNSPWKLCRNQKVDSASQFTKREAWLPLSIPYRAAVFPAASLATHSSLQPWCDLLHTHEELSQRFPAANFVPELEESSYSRDGVSACKHSLCAPGGSWGCALSLAHETHSVPCSVFKSQGCASLCQDLYADIEVSEESDYHRMLRECWTGS